MEERPQAQLYLPMAGPERAYVVIRSLLAPNDVVDSAKAILQRIDANLAFTKIHTMRELVSESTARRRFQVVLLTIFAGMALVLALVGFYGLLTYSVSQRSAEMGVRIALGATRLHVIKLVLRQGLQLVSIGLALGLAAGAALTKLLTSSLYGVSALDPITFAIVPTLLFTTMFAACLIPARRAANADPMNVLRCE
jgi:putative ABC transport system permease protein